MRTTIDSAGRVVIPKSIRDSAGIPGGAEVEIALRDGRIEIEVPAVEMKVERVNGLPVIVAPQRLRPLRAAEVDAVLQSVRAGREKAALGGSRRR